MTCIGAAGSRFLFPCPRSSYLIARCQFSEIHAGTVIQPQHLYTFLTQPPSLNIEITMSGAPRVRSIYRALLRELPPRPSQPRTPLQNKLRESFATDSSNAQSLAQAEQLVQYLKAQRQYVTLIERYNPGMGMDEEERVRLTARRVGMDLPKEYQTGEKA